MIQPSQLGISTEFNRFLTKFRLKMVLDIRLNSERFDADTTCQLISDLANILNLALNCQEAFHYFNFSSRDVIHFNPS